MKLQKSEPITASVAQAIIHTSRGYNVSVLDDSIFITFPDTGWVIRAQPEAAHVTERPGLDALLFYTLIEEPDPTPPAGYGSL